MSPYFRSFSLTKLLLLIALALLSPHAHAQSASKAPTYQYDCTIPSTEPLPTIPMNPGVTKKVIIILTGRIDTITMTFQEDAYENNGFKLYIKNNNQMETNQMATFTSLENLDLTLDTSRSLLVLQGDKGFRVSKFVREKKYDIQIRGYERNTMMAYSSEDEVIPESSEKSSKNDRSNTYFILAGVIGGLLGLVVLIKVGTVVVRRIKQRLRKSSIFSVHSRLSNKKEGDIEAGGATPVLGFEDHHGPELYAKEYKGSLTIDERGIGDNEMELAQHQGNKKEFPSSLTSIESAGMAKSTTASTMSLISSFGSLQNIVAKKGHQLAAITEESSYIKPNLPLGPLKVPPLKLEEVAARPKSRSTSSKIAPTKPPIPNHHQQMAKEIGSIGSFSSVNSVGSLNKIPKVPKENDAKSGNKQFQKKVVTLADIRELVDKVMKEKKERGSVDYSEETSKDDETEPVDYFACMVCYKDKRSTVVEPCGHVFACATCSKRVMSSSKGCCALCHKKIKGYHPLKN